MASGSNWLSGVNVVLVMAYGSLVFVLLFIFVKRQIMRFAMKSRRGPHVPVGHNAPKVAEFTHPLYVADAAGPEEKPVCCPKDAGHQGTGVGTGQQAAADGPSSGPAPAA
uniref:Uncharacterized protein n=1 Tax=Felis catus TaxID=9685 RepID=A0ABI7Z9D0_FELCA